jgi:hypothetical protein
MTRIGVILIRLYQKIVSPLFPPRCRFYPTCSNYTLEAIRKYGLLKGILKGCGRLAKCHPFHPGGFDPLD